MKLEDTPLRLACQAPRLGLWPHSPTAFYGAIFRLRHHQYSFPFFKIPTRSRPAASLPHPAFGAYRLRELDIFGLRPQICDSLRFPHIFIKRRTKQTISIKKSHIGDHIVRKLYEIYKEI